jgi:hypothetical protein
MAKADTPAYVWQFAKTGRKKCQKNIKKGKKHIFLQEISENHSKTY